LGLGSELSALSFQLLAGVRGSELFLEGLDRGGQRLGILGA
jgi:hypothetical protein